MNEMVERVAQVIQDKRGFIWDGNIDVQEEGEKLARAAMKAMRKPTQAMIDLGWAIATGDNPKTVWETMIDAALDS